MGPDTSGFKGLHGKDQEKKRSARITLSNSGFYFAKHVAELGSSLPDERLTE